jgi:hypothetical protein
LNISVARRDLDLHIAGLTREVDGLNAVKQHQHELNVEQQRYETQSKIEKDRYEQRSCSIIY